MMRFITGYWFMASTCKPAGFVCAFNSLPLSNHGGLVSFSLFLPCTTACLIRSLWRTLNTAGAYLGWTHRWVIDWYSYFLHVHTVTMKHCGCSHKENWGTSQDFNHRVLMCRHLNSRCTITSACVCLHLSTHVSLPRGTEQSAQPGSPRSTSVSD